MTVMLAPSAGVLVPLVLSLPLIAMQGFYDLRNQSRTLTAELAGALATGAVASAIVLMDDWSLTPALGLWLALAVKSITAVFYVRSRLRLERGKDTARALTVMLHAGGFVVLAAAAGYDFLPWTAPAAMAILTARAALGLSTLRRARPPKVIGMQEIGYGLMFVLLVAAGYWV